jgi:hypothetical protein
MHAQFLATAEEEEEEEEATEAVAMDAKVAATEEEGDDEHDLESWSDRPDPEEKSAEQLAILES